MTRNKNENLMTPEDLNARMTPEQRRANARKAGLASAEARKRKQTMREVALELLACPLNEQGIARMKRAGAKVDEKNPTLMTAMIVGQITSAVNGSQKSADFIRSLIDADNHSECGAQAFVDALNACEDIDNNDDIIEE